MRNRFIDDTCKHCGKPIRARVRHRSRGPFCGLVCANAGPNNHRWNRMRRSLMRNGYVHVVGAGDEHVEIAAVALGKPMPFGAEVHHVNGDRSDNARRNLVICQDRSYHRFLHVLTRIKRAGGRPFLDAICNRCKAVKPLDDFGPRLGRPFDKSGICRPCASAKELDRQRRRSEAA